MVDRLHFRVSTFVVEGVWRVEFFENAAFCRWNTGQCVDRPDRACKGCGPCNAKYRCQKGSPIHSKPPKLHELNEAPRLLKEQAQRTVK
ncbi:hypothetical protein [Mesorhizobium sp. M0091]|uniref:hypothetical protein n=1 Tax=Mesorhizobium sp. M0091 TaxID=2956875 RepID=UPI0033362A09